MLIFLAYMMPLNPSVFTPNPFGRTPSPLIQVLYLCAWLAPFTPLIVASFVLMGMQRLPVWLARLLAGCSLIAGLLLTLAAGMFSLFSTTELIHGLTLTIAVSSSFLIWAGHDHEPGPSWIAKLGIIAAAIAALWSLLTVSMILIQSHFIANGSPYCIAHHAQGSPVGAIYELRGFAFYTEATGYKSTSKWYFHGLMIVDHPDKQRIYNWSPRRWRFDLIERPDALIQPVRNACVPS
ncbi:hypothetical protein [Ruegeria sp. R14_0]|uniref:hypothetical protein n=1 Tax=Ruegeria sp. R14_0 TaxID=2821100 RepID=UPI001ADBCE57|nr:hypothetical protein [Ruegeria sp. R14_0]MBO9444399.1 hypothetical protein [Ruegeria sp. R14_0]